jgi:hypothetical protein
LERPDSSVSKSGGGEGEEEEEEEEAMGDEAGQLLSTFVFCERRLLFID